MTKNNLKTRSMSIIDFNEQGTQVFHHALTRYPREVLEMFLVHLINPADRVTSMAALNRLTDLYEERALREEIDLVRGQLDRFKRLAGKSASDKAKQLQKRLVGLNEALVALKNKKPAGGTTNVIPAGNKTADTLMGGSNH